MEQPKVSMDKVALWLGWKEININILQEQIQSLSEQLAVCQSPPAEDGDNIDLESG